MSFIITPEFVAKTCVAFNGEGIFTENKIPEKARVTESQTAVEEYK